ncbi:hypothetical protein ACFE04_003474 [Oxalis oulophora]
MSQQMFVLFILSSTLLLSYSNIAIGIKQCPNCGLIPVPYPLSTGLDCGEQSYKIRCNAAARTLWFDALDGSSYLITSINAISQRLIIRPPGLKPNACISTDFYSQGLELDDNLPFNISSSNTVIVMNCTNDVLKQAAFNCSTSSMCHAYINYNVATKLNCGGFSSCCLFKTGGSANEYIIRNRAERCSAYQSFVNLNVELPVSKWPEPGVEIEWASPLGPVCKSQGDCNRNLENSACLKDPDNDGQSRCFCNIGFRWDSIHGICQRNASAAGVKCKQKRGCKHKKSKAPIMAGIAGGVMVTGIGIAITIVVVYKKKQPVMTKTDDSLSLVRSNDSGRLSRIFPGKEITKATNNFSSDTLLGSGGYSEVYKGVLKDGTTTAIKRAKAGHIKAIDQILNEVRILCQVNHRNLVKLLGCCIELEQPLLIYEYIPNGTLFDRIHNVQSGTWSTLTWHERLHIAYQAADALAYLHSAVSPPIYHCDVKSSNILINANNDAKVSDFGLSRLALLTSMKAIDFNREQENVNLVVYLKKILKGDRMMDIIDPAIKEGASKAELESMKAFWTLASTCLDESRRNRPSMKQVANQIKLIASVFPEIENSDLGNTAVTWESENSLTYTSICAVSTSYPSQESCQVLGILKSSVSVQFRSRIGKSNTEIT